MQRKAILGGGVWIQGPLAFMILVFRISIERRKERVFGFSGEQTERDISAKQLCRYASSVGVVGIGFAAHKRLEVGLLKTLVDKIKNDDLTYQA